jgi:hypothetical protein
MTKEKEKSLTKYLQDLNHKLTSPVPEKHKGHPQTYHNFLRLEIKSTKSKLDAWVLEKSGK